MTRTLRRLDARGVAAWKAWLADPGPGAPPRHLLDDPTTSGPVEPAVAVLPHEGFQDRYGFGEWLVRLLAPLDPASVRDDAGLWDGLALDRLDLLCPPAANGRRKLGEPVRYALASGRKRPRHLVRTAWVLVRDHGEEARFMLSGPPHEHGDLVEQITSQQELIGSKRMVAVAARLYGSGRRGGAGRGGGSARRLAAVAKQLRRTWDPDSMAPEQILALLPREFERFKGPARPAPARPPARGWVGRLLAGRPSAP